MSKFEKNNVNISPEVAFYKCFIVTDGCKKILWKISSVYGFKCYSGHVFTIINICGFT